MHDKQRWVFGAMLLVVLLVGGMTSVAACSVGRVLPNPWFLVNPRFDTRNLPDGITLRYERTKYAPDGELLLTNPTATPLYVMAREEYGLDGTASMLNMPDKQGARLKLIENFWWEYRGGQWSMTLNDSQDPGPRKAWAAMLSTFGIDLHSDSNAPRPTDFMLPPPIASTVTMVYGEEAITVPVTIESVPNPDYVRRDTGGNACSNALILGAFLPHIAIAIFAVLAIVGLRLLFSSRSSS